jgi:hypothetical protein
MSIAWKANWNETTQHFNDWWNRRGLVLNFHNSFGTEGVSRAVGPTPSAPSSPRDAYVDPEQRALRNHHSLAKSAFPADVLPISNTDIGPGSLALFLGSEPGFSKETVWFEPCWKDVDVPEDLPPIKFDPTNDWWLLTEKTIRACIAHAKGDYLVGCPDLVENIDILAAMRDPQTLLFDMIERPEWVEQKVVEINRAFFESYQRIYDLIKLEDGSSCFGPFEIWGPGKTVKVQCDASAMFSPAMFEQFVVPSLTAQCAWLDNSLYHLDGTQAVCHLDALLAIDELDAIEWTPQAGIENGGDPRWYPLYRRILDGGKSVQIVGVSIEQLKPLLDAVGGRGVYVLGSFRSADEVEKAIGTAERFRS